MLNNKMAREGHAVNASPEERETVEAGMPMASPHDQSCSTADPSNEVNPTATLEPGAEGGEETPEPEQTEEELRLEQVEAAALLIHCIDSKGNIKPPSLDSLYATALVNDTKHPWACQATEATGSIIYRWKKNYWQAINNEVGACLASDWLESRARFSATDQKAAKCWAYGAIRLRRLKPMPKLDEKRAIVPCVDAYIEVHANSFSALAPDPALGMTHAIKIRSQAVQGEAYLPLKLPANSKFAKFLERALPDPATRALVQEQCGMTLLPGNYSMAAWWYGAAGTGKSTLAELVEAVHRQSVRLNLETLGDRFSLEPLIGASLILVDEVECEKWAEGRFKTVVSGNGIGIDRKNEKALASYHSRAKWLITSNGAPFIRDKSDGVWRRLTVVYWGYVIPEHERIPDFQKVLLKEEGKLVLDWMLEGARRIVARGRAMPENELPEAARLAKRRARNNSDSVRAWADDMHVAQNEGNWMPLTEVYTAFENWCGTQGFTLNEILTPRQFWKGMADAGLVRPDRKSNRRIGGKQVDCYEVLIQGRATDVVREWATARQIVTTTERVMSVEAICDSYEQWATARGIPLLPWDMFGNALIENGYVDPAKKKMIKTDGVEQEGYQIDIAELKVATGVTA